jgi:competence protein ComEA
MSGFFQSFLPIVKRLKKYKIEIFLLAIAFFSALISAGVYLATQKERGTDEEIISNEPAAKQGGGRIFVDIAGAVEKPDVYEVTAGARLKDVLGVAGGLSADADREFFSRNFNLAKIIEDQEKIYIPSTSEIQNGASVENAPTSAYNQKININRASLDELDQLPQVGKVTAQKIIENRPYQSLEDLLAKKVVNKSVYEKIKNLIIL